MAIDFDELVGRVELEFVVRFQSHELEQVRTVGDLFLLVAAKSDPQFEPFKNRYLTINSFFRIRKVLAQELKLDRREIKPSAAIEPHLPMIARRGIWRRIQARAPLRIPDLRRHDGLAALMLAFCVAVALIPIFDSELSISSLWESFGFAIWGVAVWAGLMWVTPIFTLALPKGIVTFGDLARAVRGLNYGELLAERGPTHEIDSWGRLAFLIADQLGVNANQIVPELTLNAPSGMIQSTRGQP